jgi:GNAT superfamily N-acetyltransferase
LLDARAGEDPLRDPATEPAMIRAVFVHPDWARRGIGRQLLAPVRAEAPVPPASPTWKSPPPCRVFRCMRPVDTRSVEATTVPLPNGEQLPIVRMREKPRAAKG